VDGKTFYYCEAQAILEVQAPEEVVLKAAGHNARKA